MGCRKDVRTKMRTLAHLHTVFKDRCKDKRAKLPFNNIKDMFLGENFDILRESINLYTSKDEVNVKAGLKTNLQFLLINAAKIFKATAFTEGKDNEANVFDRFFSIMKLWQVRIFIF